MRLQFKFSTFLIVALIIFTVINPLSSLDILAFLIIAFAILYKIFGDYILFVFLALRPLIDYWRDSVIFSSNLVNFNINAGIALLLFLWSVYFLTVNYRHWKELPLKWIWGAFLVWCVISWTYSFDRSATATETLKATNLFTLFAATFVLQKKYGEKAQRYFWQALLGGAIIPLALALYQLLSYTGLTIDGVPNRIYGTFAHPNILATYALLLFMVFVKETVVKIPPSQGSTRGVLANHRALAIGLAAILLATIAFTYTRIAWIGLAFFILVIGFVFYRKITVWATVAVAAAFLLFYPINDFLKTRYNYNLQSIHIIARLTGRGEEADSIKWRADVANKILPLWLRRPIIGYGYGSFPKLWNDNKGVQNIWDSTSEAHNDYLKVGFEAGIIGLALFLAIFGKLLIQQVRYGIKHRSQNIVFAASIVVYLILSVSDNMLHHTPVIWWLWALWGKWSAEQS